MDLTLGCIRRHYTGEPGSPLADVTNASRSSWTSSTFKTS
ncbi:DUF6994 family protein [Pseudarthrobacter sp. MDT3-1]